MHQPAPLDRDLATLAAAMGHPVRVQLVRRLAREGALPVRTLVEGQVRAQATVSRHLAILREAGIVRATPSGREVRYELEGPALRRLASLVAGIAAAR